MTQLPSGRFRETGWLIVAALALLFAMVVVEMQGIVALARAAEEEARAGATLAATLAADAVASGGRLPRATAGAGLARIEAGRVTLREGAGGPVEPAWWPWASEEEWQASGAAATGPLPLDGAPVVVAYAVTGRGQAVRAVLPVASGGLLTAWRRTGVGLAMLLAAAGGGLALLLLLRLLLPYRELLSAAGRLSNRRRGQGEDAYLVETFRATIERLEASEEALRRRADELEVLSAVLTRESDAGVIVVDAAGLVRAASARAANLAGAALEPGQPLPERLSTVPSETSLLLDGRTLELRRLPLRSSDGEAQGEVVLLADTTRVEALERALAEREQMASLGELSAGMTHELRNALATINGYVRLLANAEPGRRERYLGAIEQEAAAIGALLDRFLTFAQPAELVREQVDLHALLCQASAHVAAGFPTVELEVGGEAGTVHGDRVALASVLENLLRNAAEAARQGGGHVTVELTRSEGVVRVRVADDGPGVADEIRERLFAPFASTKPSGGLGLALARRLARLHGGDVALERATGGASFVLTLPAEGQA